MSLLIGSSDTIRIPLHVEIADGEDVIEVDFIGVFNRMTKTVRKAMVDRHEKLRLKHVKTLEIDTDGFSDAALKKLTDKQYAILDDIDALQFDGLIGWDDLKGHDNTVIPFSKEAKAEMLGNDPYRKAILSGMSQSNGLVDRKN